MERLIEKLVGFCGIICGDCQAWPRHPGECPEGIGPRGRKIESKQVLDRVRRFRYR